MPRFQGLHVVPKIEPPRGDSTGLQPYLALPPKRKARRQSKSRAADPDRFWWFWCLVVIGLVLSAANYL